MKQFTKFMLIVLLVTLILDCSDSGEGRIKEISSKTLTSMSLGDRIFDFFIPSAYAYTLSYSLKYLVTYDEEGKAVRMDLPNNNGSYFLYTYDENNKIVYREQYDSFDTPFPTYKSYITYNVNGDLSTVLTQLASSMTDPNCEYVFANKTEYEYTTVNDIPKLYRMSIYEVLDTCTIRYTYTYDAQGTLTEILREAVDYNRRYLFSEGPEANSIMITPVAVDGSSIVGVYPCITVYDSDGRVIKWYPQGDPEPLVYSYVEEEGASVSNDWFTLFNNGTPGQVPYSTIY